MVTFAGVEVKLEPLHAVFVIAVIEGVGLTVTAALFVAVHEFVPVTVTVYVPALDTVTAEFVPKLFDHKYVPPPLAVRVVD